MAQDFDRAKVLYRQASDNGLSDAAVNLGLLYLGNSGDVPDYEKALLFTQRAADVGNPIALNNLGHIYENGLGVTLDLAEAQSWYQRAADYGYQPGADNLARLQAAIAPVDPDVPMIVPPYDGPLTGPKVYPKSKIDN